MIPRVLMPHWLDGMNIYLDELGRAYRGAGCEVIYGADNLFETSVDVQLIHLHWPEAFYRWSGWGSPEERAIRFVAALDTYKQRGTKIVWTVHNLSPHEHVRPGLDTDVYQHVLDRADLVVHHCPKSIELLGEKYRVAPNTHQIALPHGNYLSYPAGFSRDASRKELGIPADAFVYLHFGAIRSYKGLDTLLAAFRKVKNPKKWLLVAGNYRAVSGKGAWRDKAFMAYSQYVSPRMTLHLQSVPSQVLQKFLVASDCMVLPHSRGLNSGVAVLGMTFGKLLIGPKLGCIEWVLASGNNILFETGRPESLIAAMNLAPSFDLEEVRAANAATAAGWGWDGMAKNILRHFGGHMADSGSLSYSTSERQ